MPTSLFWKPSNGTFSKLTLHCALVWLRTIVGFRMWKQADVRDWNSNVFQRFLGTGRTQRFGAYTDAGGIFWFCSSPLGAGFAKHWWEQSCLLEIDLEIHPPWHRRWRWCEQIFNVALSTWLVLDSKHKIPLAVPLCRNEIPMFGQT